MYKQIQSNYLENKYEVVTNLTYEIFQFLNQTEEQIMTNHVKNY